MPGFPQRMIQRFRGGYATVCVLAARGTLIACGLVMMVAMSRAQAPVLQWLTPANARLFAVTAQTNVYASSNGAVFLLDAGGAVISSNKVCPVPGFAQRDSAGDIYFFGSFDGTNDFGGTTLVGGWVTGMFGPPVRWEPGWPTCFVAKYNAGGHLLWVTNFGTQAQRNIAGDLVLNPDDSVTVAFSDANDGYIFQYPAGEAGGWQISAFPGQSSPGLWPIRLGSQTATNGFLLACYEGAVGAYAYDSIGIEQVLADRFSVYFENSLYTNAKPVVATNTMFIAGIFRQPILGAWQSGTMIWSVPLPVEHWVLAGDVQNNLYLAGVDGTFSKFDGNGTLIWSTNYGPPVVAMIIDASGNRFISFNDGSIGRLRSDPPVPLPAITNPPQPVEAFAGDTVSLSVTATGTPPLRYSWLFNGSTIPGAIGATLTLSGATSAQNGNYSAAVADAAGAVTSAPVTVTIKNVELYIGAQMLTNGTYDFRSAPTVTIRSAFSNGEEYYSLDGSTPSFASILYSGPFAVSNTATVKAIGYDSSFNVSEYADPVVIVLLPQFLLSVTTAGGGTVSTPGGLYVSNTVATVTATPAPGWTFLGWQGSVGGTSPTINITLNAAESVQAVFGTSLATTVSGNGRILVNPPVGPYAYGSTVRLEGIPGNGSYFGAWGNAGSGSLNPLYFAVTNPGPTVSSLFATIPANDVSLTMTVTGQGRVGVNPTGNVFASGRQIKLTATPDAGQNFLGWSGGATGTQNPLTVTLNQNALINASFSGAAARLIASASGQTSGGFTLTLVSDPGSVYQIQVSTNLTAWQNVLIVTNTSGQTQFTDSGAVNSKVRFYRAQE